MRRAGLQANDLLDIVDFIKNEEKYTARINELKAQEARLDEKLQIINTLEAAEAEERKWQLVTEAAKRDQDRLRDELEAQGLKLRDEHKERMAKVLEREQEVRRRNDQVTGKIQELEKITREQADVRKALELRDVYLTEKDREIKEREIYWRNKINQLNTIIGTA